jgi:hypothetical protein
MAARLGRCSTFRLHRAINSSRLLEERRARQTFGEQPAYFVAAMN